VILNFKAEKCLLIRHGVVHDVHSEIGDSVGDVKASKEAGVKIASVLWDSHREEKVKTMQSDYYFNSVNELSEFLLQIT
jgi:phosphoglycolate phosphatase-like HAD superfamily hydrolase